MFAFLFSDIIILFSGKRINCDFLKKVGCGLDEIATTGMDLHSDRGKNGTYYVWRYEIYHKEEFSMKQTVTMILALLLAAGLTACGNSVSQMVDDAEQEVAEYRGNVSTTDDGRVNGTNPPSKTEQDARTDRTGREPVRPMPKAQKPNTDAMGAGMR